MTQLVLPAIDHIVALVHDLDRATQDMQSAGFTVLSRADRAEKPGSRFRFTSFEDDSYILLNAFSPEAMASHRLGSLLRESQGWGDWSIVVPSLDAVMARAKAEGITLGSVNEVKNVLATGESWGLRLLVSGRGSNGDPALPFIVEDTQGRRARIPGPSAHANGARGIAGVTVAADNPLATARRLAALLDLAAPASPTLALGNVTLRFVPTRADALGTARMGGPVAVSFHGLDADISIADWALATAAD